jgi:hypothetical protein
MFAESQMWKESDGLHQLFPYMPLAVRARGDGAPGTDPQSFPGFAGPIPFVNFHAYRVIDPPADAKTLNLTLTVPRAPSRKVRFVGPEGRAMNGVKVTGLVAGHETLGVVLDGSEVDVLALAAGRPRELLATSSDGKYVARTLVSAGGPTPLIVRLRPAE